MPSAAEIWEQLDHHLVQEKWFAANEELREEIAREVNQIYSKNQGNLNSAVIPSEILEMKLRKIDEWAKRKYSIYCEVWLLQGNEISPVFVRTVYAMDIRRLIDQRGGVAAHEAESLARRTGEAKRISDARIQSFRLKVMRLQSKWRRKIEIEASELELAERRMHGTGLQHASEEAADSKVAEGPVPVGQVNDEKKQAGLAKKVARKLADPGGNPTMSFEDAAHALGVSRKHIYRLCDEGKLERAAGVSKVRTASVKALLEARA